MTTIAFDGVSISCDSQTTSGGNKELGSIKIIEGLDFFLVCSGLTYLSLEIERKVRKGATFKSLVFDGLPLESESEYPHAILIGKYEYTDCYYITGGKMFTMSLEKNVAIGSGKFIALAAMKAGANSRRAIEIASELDLYTGGEIHTRYLINN